LLLKIKISVLSIEFYKILRRKLKATNIGKKKKKKKKTNQLSVLINIR
jgi:hypothetical protein